MSRRGFTLFEVLVALTIVVILMGTLSSTISIAFKQKRAAEDAVESVRNTQTVGDIFSSDVSCATPPNPLSANPNSIVYQNVQEAMTAADPNAASSGISGGIAGMNVNGTSTTGSFLFGPFIGDNISLSFYTTGSESKATTTSGVRYVEFRLSQQSDGRLALVRRADSNLLADNAASNLPEEVLVTGVTAVSFQYYDGTGWADAWDSTGADISNMLPYAVKMVLTLEPVHANGQARVITRCATVSCAQKTVNDYNNAVNLSTNNASAVQTQ